MTTPTRSKVTAVIFHWSESLAITKIIDPDWQHCEDAQHRTSYTEARKIIKKGYQELTQRGGYCFKTYLTICFEDNHQHTMKMDLREAEQSIRQAFAIREANAKKTLKGGMCGRVGNLEDWRWLAEFSKCYDLRGVEA